MFTTGNCNHFPRSVNHLFASCLRKRVVLGAVGPLPGTWHPIASRPWKAGQSFDRQ
jgi:hypothetical protein